MNPRALRIKFARIATRRRGHPAALQQGPEMGLFGPDPHRFEKNEPGDFYTTGWCMACGAPEDEAPELLAPLEGDNMETYFVRQPSTPDEIEHACRAVIVCCANSVRYGGTDPNIIQRLGNRLTHSDNVLPGGPVRFPGENGYSWRRAFGRQRFGRRLPPWEKAMLVVDQIRTFWRFDLPIVVHRAMRVIGLS
jgi:hypothetical protein